MSVFASDYVVLDVETNGLSSLRDDLLSISLYQPDTQKMYNRFLPLELNGDVYTTHINGITKKDLKRATPLTQDEVNALIDAFVGYREMLVPIQTDMHEFLETYGALKNDVDKLTLDTYPELVNYIGTISISELSMLHALKPFDKYESGELVKLPPVSHALFYFRNPNYVEKLDDYQKLFYTNSIMGENAEVPDMNIARAKDLIYELKRELDSKEDSKTQINIRYYEGIWKDGLRRYDVISQYIREYSKLHDLPYDELMKEYGYLFDEEAVGCFADFKCENKSLKECIVEDIMNALKMEFPQNFN